MALGSPGGRRRRIIQALSPGSANAEHYASMPSSSTLGATSNGGTSRRRTQQTKRGRSGDDVGGSGSKSRDTMPTAGFRPIDPLADHGYRINVARDGSMITAVPIDEQPLRGGAVPNSPPRRHPPVRSSPVLFSQPAESGSATTNVSRQGLLDARGKQRHNKMKLMRPPTAAARANNAISSPGRSAHTARDRLRQAFRGGGGSSSPQRQQAQRIRQYPLGKPPAKLKQTQRSNARAEGSKAVRWDLSPLRSRQKAKKQQQQQQTQQQQQPRATKPQSQQIHRVRVASPILDDNSLSSFPILSPNHKFEDGADGWDEEKNSHNDHNLVSGGTQSFEALLKRRMAEIQSQKEEITAKMSKKQGIERTLVIAIDENLERNRKQLMELDEEMREIQWHLKLDSEKRRQLQQQQQQLDNIGIPRLARNPSGAYDMESVDAGDPSITADTDSVADLFKDRYGNRVVVTGRDPPARRSPPTIEEELEMLYKRDGEEPEGPRISGVLRAREAASNRPANPANGRPLQHVQTNNPSNARPPLQQNSYQWRANGILPPQTQKDRGRFVHFNLPNDSDSELKFTNSIDTSTDFEMPSTGDDISWKAEHFDFNEYDEEDGSKISSEHHDVYQWTDKQKHVVVSEHYSREDHHARHSEADRNGSRVSTDFVQTDQEPGFISTVAAVVIQTAVRRFLAEIVVAERLYAVNVIQTAICNWMARTRNPNFAPAEVHENPPFDAEPPTQRGKQVMFEDDYNDFLEYCATEIQRCYRGWWARDVLDVDHYAATTIQRVFRGWWAREVIDVDRYCALEIQRVVRGHLARMAFIYDLYCIIVAQSVIRRYLAFYSSAVRLANILYIQAVYRGYRVRSELTRYVRDGQEVAAVIIQSQWRSYDAHMNYINTLADILIVQSVARRWLTLRRVRRKMTRRLHEPANRSGYGRTKANNNNGFHTQNALEKITQMPWQQHRLKMITKTTKPSGTVDRYLQQQHDELDIFHKESAANDDWYDGNKSETSDMLKNWKGRKSK